MKKYLMATIFTLLFAQNSRASMTTICNESLEQFVREQANESYRIVNRFAVDSISEFKTIADLSKDKLCGFHFVITADINYEVDWTYNESKGTDKRIARAVMSYSCNGCAVIDMGGTGFPDN